MFTPEVYQSWEEIQWEKYEEIMKTMGKDFFVGMLKKKILDIGSGTGYFERFLISKDLEINNIISMDIRKDFMKQVDKESLIVGDGKAIPFKEKTFDVILSIDTMHLVKDIDFQRVLKNNGLVIFSTFFNKAVYEERKNVLKNLLKGFQILVEFEIHTKEKEYIIMARKE